MEGFNFVQCFL